MKLALALIVLLAAPQAARDWRTATGTAPGGGVTVGNPAAKVSLVEYLSFTCAGCANFAATSKPVLHDQMVRSGTVRVETRSAVRDPFDLAAWVMTRCAGPARFAALSRDVFAAQGDWATKGSAYAQANLETLRAQPQLRQLRMIVDRSGLAAIGARHGLTPARLDACFATDTHLKPVMAMTTVAFQKIDGTPSFEINGTSLAHSHDWASLEPQLRAAGAR